MSDFGKSHVHLECAIEHLLERAQDQEDGVTAAHYHVEYEAVRDVCVDFRKMERKLKAARDEIEQLKLVAEAAVAYRVESLRDPGDDVDEMDAYEALIDAVNAYLPHRSETTKDSKDD